MSKQLLRAIAATIKLDPTELCANASHEPLKTNFSLNFKQGWWAYCRQQTRLGHFFLFIKTLIRTSWRILQPLPQSCNDKVVIVAITLNHYDSLSPIVRQLAFLTDKYRYLKSVAVLKRESSIGKSYLWNSPSHGLESMQAWGRILAVLFFPCLVFQMLTRKGYAGRSYRWALSQYWQGYGLYLVCRCWMLWAKPSALVISNDHALFPCTINKAARDLGIPTIYVQHACVTECFPPLRFTIALLDGHDALKKYLAAGPTDTTIYLTGMAKYDAYAHLTNQSTQVDRLGVCLSKADDLERAAELLRAIAAAELGAKITLRPHPAAPPETLRTLLGLSEELGLAWSGREEKAFDFLCQQDAIIVGVSSITLEAALLNVTPINYELNSTNTDWYGFIQQGLCRSLSTPDELVSYLHEIRNNRPNINKLVAYYCETIDTPYQGHASELAAGVIHAVAMGKTPDPANWKRITADKTVTIYGLSDG